MIGITLLIMSVPNLNAQKEIKAPLPPGQPDKSMMAPSLTEQQKDQMKELRMAHLKEVQPIQNEMRELKARYETLTTAANPNMAEINKNIDAQSAAMNKLMKARASHQQDVRKIFTEEQRLFNDMNRGQGGRFQGKRGPNKGFGNMQGKPDFICPCRPDFVPPCMR